MEAHSTPCFARPIIKLLCPGPKTLQVLPPDLSLLRYNQHCQSAVFLIAGSLKLSFAWSMGLLGGLREADHGSRRQVLIMPRWSVHTPLLPSRKRHSPASPPLIFMLLYSLAFFFFLITFTIYLGVSKQRRKPFQWEWWYKVHGNGFPALRNAQEFSAS